MASSENLSSAASNQGSVLFAIFIISMPIRYLDISTDAEIRLYFVFFISASKKDCQPIVSCLRYHLVSVSSAVVSLLGGKK